MTYELKKIDPNTLSSDQWSQFHEFRRTVSKEIRPDDPVTPDHETEARMKMGNPHIFQHYFAIADGDKVISAGGFGNMKPEAPGYDTNKQFLYGDLSVLKDYRRKGIGRLWLKKVVELMKETETTTLDGNTETDSGRAFLDWAGFEGRLANAENRLNFKEIDWQLVESWIKEGEEGSPDTELVFWQDRIPSEQMKAYCDAITPVLNTMPFDDLDHGEIVMTPEVMEHQYRQLDVSNGEHHTMITKEPDGSFSGMTDVTWTPAKGAYVYQQFTGVHPSARGRGLGKWLKAKMLDFLRTKYDGLEWVVTGNANSNDSMLGINKKLGFKEFKGAMGYQISRDNLAKKVAEF